MTVSRLIVAGLALSLPLVELPNFSTTRTAHAQGYTQEGAAVGGITGAIAGSIIGHQNDETPEGAILGGVVGAVAGGLLGNAKDDRVRQQQYYRNQMIYRQQQQAARAVSFADVVNMSRRGISDSVIINHLQTNGIQRSLSTNDVITLHQNGVSEQVINVMQQLATQLPGTPLPGEVIPPHRSSVIVHKQYHLVPRYAPAPRVHIYHHRPHRRPGWYHHCPW